MPTNTPRVAVLGAAFSRFHGLEPDRFADLNGLLAAPVYDVLLIDLPGALPASCCAACVSTSSTASP